MACKWARNHGSSFFAFFGTVGSTCDKRASSASTANASFESRLTAGRFVARRKCAVSRNTHWVDGSLAGSSPAWYVPKGPASCDKIPAAFISSGSCLHHGQVSSFFFWASRRAGDTSARPTQAKRAKTTRMPGG